MFEQKHPADLKDLSGFKPVAVFKASQTFLTRLPMEKFSDDFGELQAAYFVLDDGVGFEIRRYATEPPRLFTALLDVRAAALSNVDLLGHVPHLLSVHGVKPADIVWIAGAEDLYIQEGPYLRAAVLGGPGEGSPKPDAPDQSTDPLKALIVKRITRGDRSRDR
jgi:hypothetical protein